MNISIPGAHVIDVRASLLRHKTQKYSKRKLSDIRSAAIHHSLTVTGTPEAFANYHVQANGWPGIAYPFVIPKDGTIYWCLDLELISYHVGNSNRHALGICLVGDFRTQQPTPAQLDSLNRLLKYLQGILPNMKQILGHSEYPGYSWKQCPVINMNMLRLDYSQYVGKLVDKVEDQPCWIEVNGQLLKKTGVIRENKSYLPVREVAATLGKEQLIGFCSTTKKVILNKQVLQTTTILGGAGFAITKEIVEALGLQVEWNAVTKTVKLRGGR